MSASPRPEISAEAAELMGLIRERYLSSREFNCLDIHSTLVEPSRAPAIELLQAGLVEVITGADYMNIHIRPWPSRRSVEEQIHGDRVSASN